MLPCVKGDDGDGPTSAVSDYVEQLRLGLIQQAADERISWLESQFQGLVHKKSKGGKPSAVDISQFLKLPIGRPEGGGLKRGELISNIINKLIGDLPDSSAAASAPAMGFVVALFFVELLHFILE